MSEVTKLGDCVEIITGNPFRSSGYTEQISGIRLLRGDNIVQGRIRWEGAKYWPAMELQNYNQYRLQAGDVVLAMDRPWIEAGLKYAELRPHDVPSLLVQRTACLRARPGIDQRFLTYLVGSPKFTDYILGVQTGTAVPHISAGQIKEFRFELPELSAQKEIGHVLGALDDKIAVNYQINDRLDAMTQALFQLTFVIPTLGGLPEGWRTGTLSDICATQYGYTASATHDTGGPKFLRVKDINKNNWIQWESVPYCIIPEDVKFKYLLYAGDLVVARMADPGKAAIIESDVDAVFASYLVRLKAESLAHAYYVYGFLKSEEYASYVAGARGGSVQANMNARVIVGANLPIPPIQAMEFHLEAVLPIRQLIMANLDETNVLAELRDALLPRLMSGEIRVLDVEKLVEDAT